MKNAVMDKRLRHHTCPVCNKKFFPAVFHSYKDSRRRLVCSYSCMLADERKKRKGERENA